MCVGVCVLVYVCIKREEREKGDRERKERVTESVFETQFLNLKNLNLK